MTATFFMAGMPVKDPRIEPGTTGVRIILNERGDWLTLENRDDCQLLMQAAADADSMFIRQKARTADAGWVPCDHGSDEACQNAAAEPRTVVEMSPGAFMEALAAGEPPLDPDCQAGKHGSCVGDPCECDCHAPPLPQRIPGGPPPWQADMNAELSPEALAKTKPLVSLAPEPQEEAET